MLFAILTLLIPPILAIVVRRKTHALLFGTVAVWTLMVAGAQYNLATDPEYNSIAPGVSIVAGWIPGVVYSGLCVAIVTIASSIARRYMNELTEPVKSNSKRKIDVLKNVDR